MTAVEKVDWFCPKCNSYVSSESVTFEETHQICNTGVIIEPLNQNQMEKTAVEFLASVLSQAGQITKDDFDSLVKQAKEMEREHSHKYAEFSIRCDRMGMKILNFQDWIKLEPFKSE